MAGPPARSAAGRGKALCEALPFHGPIRCRRKGKGLVRSTFLSPAAPLAARVFAERLAGAQAFTSPCAHHWQANAPRMAGRFAKKRLATGTGRERAARIAKPFTAEGLPMRYEREVHKLSPFTGHARGRAPLCGALARRASIHLPVGRARGAPCKTAAHSAIGEAIALPLAAGPWRRRHGHWQSVKPQAARHWQSVKPQAGRPPEKPMLRT